MFLDNGNKEECCGCTACESVCPVDAISMKKDNEGFLYPKIDQSICIDCHLCRKVCPFSKDEEDKKLESKYPKVFAFKHKDDFVRINSSSGGAFSAISDYVLFINGVIYGAAFDKDYVVRHIRVTDKNGTNKMRKSKYVQSDLNGIFRKVKADLAQEKLVLFTGSPCQTDGLRNYLRKSKVNMDNLILCDIICHGVPSPLIWENYLKQFSDKNGKINLVDFRAKTNNGGWNPLKVHVNTDSTEYLKDSGQDAYYRLFFNHYIVRPSCHNCKFTNLDRPSDITIADFWGIEKTHPDFADDLGVSLILLNSEKGENIFNSIKDKHVYLESNTEECLQPNLIKPTPENPLRSNFWKEYDKKGFKYVLRKYGELPLKSKIKDRMKAVLKKAHLFNIAKRIVKGK